MQYAYEGWYLYSKDVCLKNSPHTFKIYFFSRKQPKSGTAVSTEAFQAMNAVVKENQRTGMPYIKRRG